MTIDNPTHPDAPRAGGETPDLLGPERVEMLRKALILGRMREPYYSSSIVVTADELEALLNAWASLLARHRDGERADWWEAETRRVLRAVCAEGTDTTERVTRLALNLRPANAHTPPPSVRDRVREERETIPEPTHD